MVDKTEGNDPLNENVVTRKEIVANQSVDVLYDKDDTEFKTPLGAKNPDGLEGEELEAWHGKAKNEFKMAKSANDKYSEAAELKREIKNEREQLKKDMEAFKELKRDYKAPEKEVVADKPDFYKILSEVADKPIRDIDDELEFEEDNRKLYLKAKRKYENEKDSFIMSRTTNPSNKIESILMRERIERDGAEYGSVDAFAKLRGWKVDSYSYEAYKNANPKKDSETEKINKYTQPTDYVWLDAGKKVTPVGKKLEDQFENADDLSAYLDSEMAKEHPDPRVLEFLKD